MTDIYTKDKRSKIMSNIGSVSTKPEIIIRKSLFSKKDFAIGLITKNYLENPILYSPNIEQ